MAPQSLLDRVAAIRSDPRYAGQADLPFKVTFVGGGVEGDRLILKSDEGSSVPPAAVLRIVGQISRDSHNLKPVGTYNPAYKYEGQDITKAKLRFYINAPTNMSEEFASLEYEFDNFVGSLKAIHDVEIDSSKSPKLFRPFADNMDVTILHQLVIPREDEDEEDCAEYHDAHDANNDETSTIASNDTAMFPSPFSFEGWPVNPDGLWRQELDSFKDTHDIYPMQAFTKDGKLIRPSDYTKKLLGAVVDLSFTLVHYNFTKRFGGSSRMCLYMTELHVLVPPVPLPGSPRSRNGKATQG